MKRLLRIAALSLSTPALAQPFSESMADCAALYQNAAQWVNTDESADRLMFAATRWADAAIAQARTEGQPASEAAIWQRIDTKTEKWEAKGQGVFFSQDFRDWTQYCRKFAAAQGIRINP